MKKILKSIAICLLLPLTVNAKEYNGIELTDEQVVAAKKIGYTEESLNSLDEGTLLMIQGIVPSTVKSNSIEIYQTTTPLARGSVASGRGDKTLTVSTFQSGSKYYAGASVEYSAGNIPSSRKLEGLGFTWSSTQSSNIMYAAGMYYNTSGTSTLYDRTLLGSNIVLSITDQNPFGNKTLSASLDGTTTDRALFGITKLPSNNSSPYLSGTSLRSAIYAFQVEFNSMPTGVCVSNYDHNGKSVTANMAGRYFNIYPYNNAVFKYTTGTTTTPANLASQLNRTYLCV